MGSEPPGPPRGVTVPKNVLQKWVKQALRAKALKLAKDIGRYVKMADY